MSWISPDPFSFRFQAEVKVLQKDLKALWQEVMDKAAPNLPDGTAELWLKSCLPEGIEDGRLVLSAANIFVRDHIMKNFLGELNRTVESVDGLDSIQFEALGQPEPSEDKGSEDEKEVPGSVQRAGRASRPPAPVSPEPKKARRRPEARKVAPVIAMTVEA